MFIHVDYNSGEPIIRQVISQIKRMRVDGTLNAGDRLPSIRELAKQLKINPTTVTRIYNELEHEGIVVLRQGQGAFVTESSVVPSRKAARKDIARHAQMLLVEGLRRGLSCEDVQEVLLEEYEKLQREKPCQSS